LKTQIPPMAQMEREQCLERDPWTFAVIGAAMEVHQELGPGFMEKVYQEALAFELAERAVPYLREYILPIRYKNRKLASDYRADFVCFDDLLVETKAQKSLTDIGKAQVINYLKVSGIQTGLLINIGARSLEYERLAYSAHH
jgi:GxxExxY protein